MSILFLDNRLCEPAFLDDLKELQREVAAWAGRNFPSAQPYAPLLGMTEELAEIKSLLEEEAAHANIGAAVGRLAHAHLKGDQGIRHTPEQIRELKEDGVGDILVFLLDYCQRAGLDASLCLIKTWVKVRQRDWTANRMNGGQP